MKDKLFGNLGLKILALIMGFIVWLIVLNLDDYSVTKTIRDIPVTVLNEDAITSNNQLYDITDGDTVDIVVKGRRTVVENLTADDFLATADLSKLSVTNAVQIQVEAIKESINNAVTITVVDNMMVIELEAEETRSFPILVTTTGDAADGYTIGNGVATPNLITVTGAASVINNIAKVEVNVDVSGQSSDVSVTKTPVFYDLAGDVIDSDKLTGASENVSVTVPIYKTKTVPVNITTTGELPDMYVVADIEYVPEEITIGGTAEALQFINSIDISDIDISGYTEDLEATIDVSKYLPDDVVVADENSSISVRVNIERYVSRELTISEDDIKLTGQAEDVYYAISFAEDDSVVISGLSDKISGLMPSDLNISIDVSEYDIGDHYIILPVEDTDDYTVSSSCTIILSITNMP